MFLQSAFHRTLLRGGDLIVKRSLGLAVVSAQHHEQPTRWPDRQDRHVHCTPRLNVAPDDVEFTAVRYAGLARGNFNMLSENDIKQFKSILDNDDHRILTHDLDGYNIDWLKTVRGQSKLVLKPKTTEEVSAILKYCNEKNLAVCTQGGNTGLVGGSVPVFDEVILSLSLMDNVENIDTNSSVVICQAGLVLEKLDQYLSENDLMVPLDLGAKGSCQIGGNISTNAGGVRLLRYGNLHGNVLGLEVVLADGEILDCMSEMKKDNTGYDLKHLFIGSEGTLGVVTKVALHCPTRPKAVNVALVSLKDFKDVLTVFRKTELGEILSSCELIDQQAMKCVTENLDLKCPIGNDHEFYLLIETSGSRAEHDEEKLTYFLDNLMGHSLITDGTLATSGAQIESIWPLRERLAEALLKDGYCYKYDISLPLNEFYHSVTTMREVLGDSVIRCVGYGHLGDGNMHLNMTSKVYDNTILSKIEPFLYEWISKRRGSISAEHGEFIYNSHFQFLQISLGFKKRNCIHYSKSTSAVKKMVQLKKMFDPKGILNPYKVLPDDL